MVSSIHSLLNPYLHSLPKLTTTFVQKEILGFNLLCIFEAYSHMTLNKGDYVYNYINPADKNSLKYMFLFEIARGCFYLAKPRIASKVAMKVDCIVRAFAYGLIVNITTSRGVPMVGHHEPSRPIISYNDPRLSRGPYLDMLSRIIHMFKDIGNPIRCEDICLELLVKLASLTAVILLPIFTAPLWLTDRLFRVIRYHTLTNEQRLNPLKVSFGKLSLPNCEPCDPPKELKIAYNNGSLSLITDLRPHSLSGPQIGECVCIKDGPLKDGNRINARILSVNLQPSEVCHLPKESLDQLKESLTSDLSSLPTLKEKSENIQTICRALFLKNGYRAVKCEWEGETVWSFFDIDCLTAEAIEYRGLVRFNRVRFLKKSDLEIFWKKLY